MSEPVIQITLIIVESCNLNCKYCYEKHKDNTFMSFSTAKQIIDQEFAHIAPSESVNIEFFGGEPFLNFQLIKQVVSYVEENYPHYVTYNTTTNGTLLTREVKEWLYFHRKNFFAALSLDGDKTMHDSNRIMSTNHGCDVGSYDLIDQQFFLDTFIPPTVKMTIAPNILKNMANGIIYLSQKGFTVDATLAMGDIDWSGSENIKILLDQLYILIDFYRMNPEYDTVRMLKVPVEAVFAEETLTSRFCGAGNRIHCYTGNNLRWTPCQAFSRITIGDKESEEYELQDFNNYIEPDGVCKRCAMSNLCNRCWGTNLAATGSIDKVGPWYCVINRLLIVAGAKILYNRIINSDKLTELEQRQMKAISYIAEEAFKPNGEYLMNFSDI